MPYHVDYKNPFGKMYCGFLFTHVLVFSKSFETPIATICQWHPVIVVLH